MTKNTKLNEELKLTYNKKMINKRVFVTLAGGGFFGTVIDVIDDEKFKVKPDKGEERVVEIFDIRSLDGV